MQRTAFFQAVFSQLESEIHIDSQKNKTLENGESKRSHKRFQYGICALSSSKILQITSYQNVWSSDDRLTLESKEIESR